MAYITIEENNEERLEKLKRILEENGFEVVETEKSEDSEDIYRFDGLEVDDERKIVP